MRHDLGIDLRYAVRNLRCTPLRTFAVIASVLATAALLASDVPARRATRVDPVTTIRAE